MKSAHEILKELNELRDILLAEYQACNDYIIWGDEYSEYDWDLLASIEQDARDAGLDTDEIMKEAFYYA